MISAEAPILFAKACEIMIRELTMRAWIHAEENKRRTLQRSDIATAISKSDMFDFLIDIVPRDEILRTAGKSPEKDYRGMMSSEHTAYQYGYGMQHTPSYNAGVSS
ncbi:histone-fold-containing protein [Syncephalis plumigaleata]|nr:histone-fold-containing protein [Syncephalis plumigaleata]